MSGTITRNQWIAIIILALGLISGATGQMTDIFGAGPAKSIASAASFMSSFVAGVQIILGGQGQQIQDVRNIAVGPSGAVAISAQKALIEATSAVAQDKTIPKSDDAKDALIAATIGLDEVQTIVTDKKTADASPSGSVVAAEEVHITPKAS